LLYTYPSIQKTLFITLFCEENISGNKFIWFWSIDL